MIGDRKTLLDAVNHAKYYTPRKSSLPVLTNVHILARDGECKIQATDLDLSITLTIPAEGAIDCTVPVKRLSSVLAECESTEVLLSYDGRLTITGDDGEVSLVGIDVEDFPQIPEVTLADWTAEWDWTEVWKAFSDVGFAASRDETRPSLNGVYLDKGLMIATDGHRLVKTSCETGADNVIVPPGFFKGIHKLHGNPPKTKKALAEWIAPTVRVQGSEAFIFAHGHNGAKYTITARLIGGPYPNYEQIIPDWNDRPIQVEVSGKALVGAIRKALVICNAWTYEIKLEVRDNLYVCTKNPDTGAEGKWPVPAKTTGQLDIGVNGNYALDTLRMLAKHGDDISLAFGTPVEVILARTPDSPLTLIMPLRLSE